MTKEAALNPAQYSKTGRQWSNNFAAKQGYAGFVDVGGGFGIGNNAGPYTEVTTSHGCQIIPYLFMGAGFGFHYDFDWEAAILPIFVDLRCNFLNSNVTPFVGMKVGYSVLDAEGLYFNPSIGCRFGLSNNFAMNVTFNYQMQKATFGGGWGYYYVEAKRAMNNIGFKVGFEF